VWERLRDSLNSIMRKSPWKCEKGSVIAEIPSCERKVRERLRDNKNSIVWKKNSWKGLLDSRRLRESLNPTVKGIPTERPKTTTSCGLNPTVKGIPTERPETTTSCGLNPVVKGIPTEKTWDNCKLWPRSYLDQKKYIFIFIFSILYVKRREGPRGSEISEE
jgi:hypothetical protein